MSSPILIVVIVLIAIANYPVNAGYYGYAHHYPYHHDEYHHPYGYGHHHQYYPHHHGHGYGHYPGSFFGGSYGFGGAGIIF